MIILLATLLNLIGGALIVRGHPYLGHWCFVVADPVLIGHTMLLEEYELCLMFGVYFCLAVAGVCYYHKKKVVKEEFE